MGREIRRVPKDWKHPKDKYGRFIPMYAGPYTGDYEQKLNSWIKNYQLWQKGEHPDQLRYPTATEDCKYYALWESDPPALHCSNPVKWSETEACCFQLYENVTEGTPIGPIFETLDRLEDWLVESEGYSMEAAKALFEFGILPSFALEGKAQPAIENSTKCVQKKKKGKRL